MSGPRHHPLPPIASFPKKSTLPWARYVVFPACSRNFDFRSWKLARHCFLPAGNFSVKSNQGIKLRSDDPLGTATTTHGTCSRAGRANPDKHAPDFTAPMVAVVLGRNGDLALNSWDRFLCVPRPPVRKRIPLFISLGPSHARAIPCTSSCRYIGSKTT